MNRSVALASSLFVALLSTACMQMTNAALGQSGGETVHVLNASSVSICAVTVGINGPASDKQYENRLVDKMTVLAPGAKSAVTMPPRKKDGTKVVYSLKAFTCKDERTLTMGALLSQVDVVDPAAPGPVVLK